MSAAASGGLVTGCFSGSARIMGVTAGVPGLNSVVALRAAMPSSQPYSVAATNSLRGAVEPWAPRTPGAAGSRRCVLVRSQFHIDGIFEIGGVVCGVFNEHATIYGVPWGVTGSSTTPTSADARLIAVIVPGEQAHDIEMPADLEAIVVQVHSSGTPAVLVAGTVPDDGNYPLALASVSLTFALGR